MKITSNVEHVGFSPVTMEITFETPEELAYFWKLTGGTNSHNVSQYKAFGEHSKQEYRKAIDRYCYQGQYDSTNKSLTLFENVDSVCAKAFSGI